MNNTLTRRHFLAAAAGTAAFAASASVARADEAAWGAEADVVVVGLGAAGAAAAVSAIESGASVIVLESEAIGGGSTAICGGLVYFGGGTQTQLDAGVEDTPEDFKAYISAAAGPSGDPELIDVFCANSIDNYNWLVDNGVVFEGDALIDAHVVTAPEGVVLSYSGNERAREYAAIAKPAPRGHTPVGGGAGILAALGAKIDAAENAQVLYETRAMGLVMAEDGSVAGVCAIGADGAELLVKANKGVVLAAGAFTYNDQLLADYAPEVLMYPSRVGVPSDRGDGIVMGIRAGAATRSMSRMGIWEFLYMYGDMAAGIMVDKNGLRFLAEDWYGSWIGRKVSQNTAEACYVVVDDAMMADIAQTPYGAWLVPAATAESIEDLAAQLDVPAGNVVDSVSRYNALCESGEDTDYGKSPEYLKPIATPPFYAFDGSPRAMGSPLTLGGLKISANAEVISLDGAPIAGLYAAGRTSCGIYGEYPGSGTSVADCITFGRIAGAQAAAR